MNHRVEVKLKEELDRLKLSSRLGLELNVAWHPDGGNLLAGEVVDKMIRIYGADEAKRRKPRGGGLDV